MHTGALILNELIAELMVEIGKEAVKKLFERGKPINEKMALILDKLKELKRRGIEIDKDTLEDVIRSAVEGQKCIEMEDVRIWRIYEKKRVKIIGHLFKIRHKYTS